MRLNGAWRARRRKEDSDSSQRPALSRLARRQRGNQVSASCGSPARPARARRCRARARRRVRPTRRRPARHAPARRLRRSGTAASGCAAVAPTPAWKRSPGRRARTTRRAAVSAETPPRADPLDPKRAAPGGDLVQPGGSGRSPAASASIARGAPAAKREATAVAVQHAADDRPAARSCGERFAEQPLDQGRGRRRAEREREPAAQRRRWRASGKARHAARSRPRVAGADRRQIELGGGIDQRGSPAAPIVPRSRARPRRPGMPRPAPARRGGAGGCARGARRRCCRRRASAGGADAHRPRSPRAASRARAAPS